MPATTPHEHWPYPLLADPADPASVQALATAMDSSLTGQHRPQAALHRAVNVARTNGSVTATVGTNAYLTFTTIDFDTAGMVNLTTGNDRITLPAYPTVVRVEATASRNFVSGTITSLEIGVERALTTAMLVRRYQPGNTRLRVAGLIKCAASDRLRLRLAVTGTTGGSVPFTGRLTAFVVCRAT
jgi:hypothetical protein